MSGANRREKGRVALGEFLGGRAVLGEIDDEAGGIDFGKGCGHFRLSPTLAREAQAYEVNIEHAAENRLVAHARLAGATALSY